MKVFLAATSLHPEYGGPAYSVSRLAAALAAAGVEVGLWAPDQSASTSPLIAAGTGVQRLTGTESHAVREFGRPDVLHDNGIWLAHNHGLATLAASRGIARIVSTRGMLEPWAMNHKRAKKWLAWRLYQRRDLVRARLHHATSEVEAENVRQLDLGVPVRIVVNGVDVPGARLNRPPQAPANSEPTRRTALFLGRIYPVKGLPMLIEAWARERPNGWRLLIAGPDEAGHRADVERVVTEAGLGDVVSFAGQLAGDAKQDAYFAADLFVLPTHSESFGMSVAEALAHSLPVLTTTAAPWPALEEQGCGWRVAPSVDGLANGLRIATSHEPNALRAMGARGRKVVSSDYSWPRVAEQFIAICSGLV